MSRFDRVLLPVLLLTLTSCRGCGPRKQPEGSSSPSLTDRVQGKRAALPASTNAPDMGVPECDEYIRKFETCITEHVPEHGREAFRIQLGTQKSMWLQAMKDPAGREAMPAACGEAMAGAQHATQGYECEW